MKWHHLALENNDRFYIENYCRTEGKILSDLINKGNFDIVITSTYHFCAYLNTKIPIIYYADLTYAFYKRFFDIKDDNYDHIAESTEKFCLNNATAILYPTEWARDSAIAQYKIPKEKTHVIEFGANIPDQDYVMIPNTSPICNLLFVGRHWKNKGGDIILEAYRILKLNGFHCSLTIVGCRPPYNVDDSGITIYEWLDKSNPQDLETYLNLLQKSHFLVLPTRFEAYGIVLCEAAAYGTPCIVADVGGTSQPVRHLYNGILMAQDSSPNEYAQIIKDTYNNIPLYENLSKQSLSEYQQRLNWNVWTDKVTAIAERLHLTEKKRANTDLGFTIPTYIINLPEREDRKKHILTQFKNKEEFKITYINAIKHEIGAIGLWESIKKSIQIAQNHNEDIILICEDDHMFTKDYSMQKLFSCIIAAHKHGVEVISGGTSNYNNAIIVNDNLCLVDKFLSTQFIILFKPIFSKILDYEFTSNDVADIVIPKISSRSMIIHPFISIQKDFGYSDVTEYHNQHPGFIYSSFRKASHKLSNLRLLNKQLQY